MKILLAFFLPILCVQVRAGEDSASDSRLVKALAALEKKMDIKFDIPFPANFDVDAYRKRPLALISIKGSKVCATRPIVNPYDEPGSIEWMLGPADVAMLPQQGVDCSADFDEQGDFSRLNFLADWATDGTGNHQLTRAEGESGGAFFERAFITYRIRAAQAKDPVQAHLYLAAFEKIASAIHRLRNGLE